MKYIRLSIVLICMLMLMACGSNNSYQQQLVGSWYLEGNQEAAFILYDDGTCEIAGEYGTGTWSIVNGNQLNLTNFYGETENAMIEKVTNEELILSVGDEKSIFTKFPSKEPEVDEKIIDNEEENLSELQYEGKTKNYRDSYEIQSVINPSYHYSPFTINSNEHFWVEAVSVENKDEHRMLNINLEGEIFMDVPFVGSTNISVVEDKYICKSNSEIYDIDGNDITGSFCDNEEEFVGVFRDATGWTVWVCESLDTYDSHEFIIRAQSLEGTVKGEWSQKELKNKYEEVFLSNEINFLGGSWYVSGNMIFNVENRVDIWRQGADYCGADNDFLCLCFSDGWLSADSIVLYDSQGNNVTPSLTFLEQTSFWFDRYLKEGMMLLENHKGFVVIDSTGNFPFDVNIFGARGTWGDSKSINSFHSGKAQVEMINESGVNFSTLIDNNGDFLFEPIKGTIKEFYYEDMWKFQYPLYRETEESSFLMDDAGKLIKNSGEIYIKEGDELKSYITIESGKVEIYPVEYID